MKLVVAGIIAIFGTVNICAKWRDVLAHSFEFGRAKLSARLPFDGYLACRFIRVPTTHDNRFDHVVGVCAHIPATE